MASELGTELGDKRKMVMEVRDIRDKLKYWDYENVLQVHESLQFVNESINELGLVPESFQFMQDITTKFDVLCL